MELREVMQKRKSIRQYLTTPVEEEKVKAMIEAACTDLEKCSGDPLLCGGFRRKKTGSTGCPG